MEELVPTDIGLINILDPISDERIWNNQKIQLQDKLAFFGGVIFSEPMPPSTALSFIMHGLLND